MPSESHQPEMPDNNDRALVEFAGAYFQAIHSPDSDCEPGGARGFDGRMVGPVPVGSIPDEDACNCWKVDAETNRSQGGEDGAR